MCIVFIFQTLSLIYTLLSIAAIIFRFTNCVSPTVDSNAFWTIVTTTYIREGTTIICKNKT